MIKKILLITVMSSAILSAVDYGMAVDSVKTPEAIQAASKGKDVTMDDVSKSVDSDKLTKAVMGSKEEKAKAKVKEIKEDKKTKETAKAVNTGTTVGKSLGFF